MFEQAGNNCSLVVKETDLLFSASFLKLGPCTKVDPDHDKNVVGGPGPYCAVKANVTKCPVGY